ncbi:MAG: hypothetical protein C4563_09325 [Desulfobulbus sp.]|nr:MAG: hypothetical protein C4563_09325 [Desulfobulbus sp.]
MKKRIGLLATLLITLLATGTGWTGQAGDGTDMEASVPAAAAPQWTFLFYLAADNEQEAYADNTVAQLVAGTANVPDHPQILVLLDRLSVPGTEVFEIRGGEILPLASEEEQNSADGAVLQDFAAYALSLAANERIAFIMKSEGLSWRGIGRDNTHEEALPDQLMSNGDLAEALTLAQASVGRKVDLLVLEGSIMGFMEVVYELRDAAPVLVATQSKIQPDGLPWTMVIEDLGASPDMSAADLGIAIADNHLAYYSDKGNNGVPQLDTSTNFAALTVFDLTTVQEVLAAHNVWAETTWLLFDEIYNVLPHARDLAEVGGFGEITDFDYNFDIRTFMEESLALISEEGLDFPELTAAVATYLAAQDKLIIYERSPADGFKLKAAQGVSIWYPPTWNKYDTRDENSDLFGSTMYYEDPEIGLDWLVDSNWRSYLFEYFDRAAATLAGKGADGDEPPKPGVFK